MTEYREHNAGERRVQLRVEENRNDHHGGTEEAKS